MDKKFDACALAFDMNRKTRVYTEDSINNTLTVGKWCVVFKRTAGVSRSKLHMIFKYSGLCDILFG